MIRLRWLRPSRLAWRLHAFVFGLDRKSRAILRNDRRLMKALIRVVDTNPQVRELLRDAWVR